jgi:hypothetical protein
VDVVADLEEGVSVAKLVRRGADLVLEQAPFETRAERERPALAVVGRFPDVATDVARQHDSYLHDERPA